VLDGVQLIGSGTVADRLWTRFALSVVGIDAPSVLEARAAIVPHARAKLNLRIPPGADPAAARDALIAHLRAHAPWGAQLEIEAEPPADGIVMPAGGPAVRAALDAFAAAYGRPAATMGSGGSIPLTAALRAAAPGSEILVVGAQDADRANIHAPDESVAIAELERFALAEALLLAELGRVVAA
jgi:acetylornithine deacetylase/succinyl-diaminopimelate desuccinylase-like protein